MPLLSLLLNSVKKFKLIIIKKKFLGTGIKIKNENCIVKSTKILQFIEKLKMVTKKIVISDFQDFKCSLSNVSTTDIILLFVGL